MKETIKNIAIGAIGSLVASGIIYTFTDLLLWNIPCPLWIWLLISVTILLIYCCIRRAIIYFKVQNILSEYCEGRFGDSYEYVWEYKKSPNSPYSAFGYEPKNIRLKDTVKESLNRPNTYVFGGHEVQEDDIKRIIQLTLIAKVDNKMEKILYNTLQYLHSKHN